MSTLITENTSTSATADSSGAPCRTDRSATRDGYRRSRWNSAKWQTRRNGLLVCRRQRCPYEFCGLDDEQLPPYGSACRFECIYAVRLADEFDALFPVDGIGRHMDDRDHWRREFILGHLLANRASVRASLALQRCFNAVADRGDMPVDQQPFHEYDIARRYRHAARNRVQAVWDQLKIIEERAREARVRTLMLQHGYWNPYRGEESPSLEDAPSWIVREASARVT